MNLRSSAPLLWTLAALLAALARAGGEAPEARTVRRLNVVDEKGLLRGSLHVDEKGRTKLSFHSEQGVVTLELGTESKRPEAELSMLTATGDWSAALSSSSEHPMFTVRSPEHGRAFALINVTCAEMGFYVAERRSSVAAWGGDEGGLKASMEVAGE